ncbi:hypothetical protein RFI_01867 [Reticulomyxa filosa]|uniref:Uncharacterized protein n=1 Tax=Reticulomyxa filosa TaxID=46433 RepID=X6PAW3_RETFI|nr:hypothetical protein RFI_01867 [Reticulomyxa filosa]|eukprot:ETO35209.1 hypothetical protein RFI_01867 [Reticulomyxa filosa]
MKRRALTSENSELAGTSMAHGGNDKENDEKAERKRDLSAHQDLLAFFLLRKHYEKLKKEEIRNSTYFYTVPKNYLNGVCGSLPSNFEDVSNKQLPAPSMPDMKDRSLLVTLLGNYEPPQQCHISPLLEMNLKSLNITSSLNFT